MPSCARCNHFGKFMGEQELHQAGGVFNQQHAGRGRGGGAGGGGWASAGLPEQPMLPRRQTGWLLLAGAGRCRTWRARLQPLHWRRRQCAGAHRVFQA